MAEEKKVVHYKNTPIIVNGHAFLWPVDHPDGDNVSNTKQVRTSLIVSYDKVSGEIETQNTVYLPVKEH